MDRLIRSKLFAPLVLAATLALGAQGVWGFACLWSQAVIGAGIVHPLNESLEITPRWACADSPYAESRRHVAASIIELSTDKK